MITDFYPQFTDKFGKPLAGGRVSFYEPDSFTLTKSVYLDYERTVVGQSIQPLNSAGRFEQGILFPSDGTYNIVVERRQGDGYVIEYSGNDIQFVSISASASVVVGFGTDISTLEATGQENELKYIAGYYNSDDNGGGWFRWDASNVDAADGGSIIKPFGIAVGAWVRIINDDHIRPEQWGIIPDEANVYTTAFTLLSVYGTANGKTIHMSKGDYNIGGDITFNCPVIMDEVVEFTGTGTVTFANDLNAVQKEPICDVGLLLDIPHKQDYPVEIKWWRVSQGIITDSSEQLMQAINHSGDNALIIREEYMIAETAPFTQSGKKLIFDGGSLYVNGDFIITAPIFQPHLIDYKRNTKVITGDYNKAQYTLGEDVTYIRPPSSIDMSLFYEDGEVIDTTRYIPFATNSDFIDGDTVLNWGSLKVSFIGNVSTIQIGHVFNGAEITLESTATSVRFNDYISLQDRQVFFGDSYPIVNQDIDPIHFGNFSTNASVDNAPMLNRALEASLVSRVPVNLKGRTYSILSGINTSNYTVNEMYNDDRKLVIHSGKIVSRITDTSKIFTLKLHCIMHNVDIESLSGSGECFFLQLPSNGVLSFPTKGLYLTNCNIKLSDNVTMIWCGTALVSGVYLSIPIEIDHCNIFTNTIMSTSIPFNNANFGTRLRIRYSHIERDDLLSISDIYCGSYCEFISNEFINNFRIKLESVPMFPVVTNNPVINTKIIDNGFKTDSGITSIIESSDIQLIDEGNDAVVKDNYLINKLVDADLPATEGVTRVLPAAFLDATAGLNPNSGTTNITSVTNTTLVRGVDFILPRNSVKLAPIQIGRLYDADIVDIQSESQSGSDLAYISIARINYKQYTGAGLTQFQIAYSVYNSSGVDDIIEVTCRFKFRV